jgi:hypothetical protein
VTGKIDAVGREKDPHSVAGANRKRLLSGLCRADAWNWIMSSNDAKKGGGHSRAVRLEAQLRANLKKRKEQARARARGADAQPRDTKDAASDGGEE